MHFGHKTCFHIPFVSLSFSVRVCLCLFLCVCVSVCLYVWVCVRERESERERETEIEQLFKNLLICETFYFKIFFIQNLLALPLKCNLVFCYLYHHPIMKKVFRTFVKKWENQNLDMEQIAISSRNLREFNFIER